MLDGRGTARHGTARPTYQNTKTWANPILILTHNTPHTPTRLERVALADAELGGVGAPERVERAVGARERHGMVPPAGHLFLGGGDGGVGRIMITLGGWLVAGLWDKTHSRTGRSVSNLQATSHFITTHLGDGLPVERRHVLEELLVLEVAQPELPVVVQARRPHLRLEMGVRSSC